MLYCFVQEREAELLRRVQELAPGYRVRPSLLQPLSSAIGFSLGAVAGILPREASGAITGMLCQPGPLHPLHTCGKDVSQQRFHSPGRCLQVIVLPV